MGSSVKLSAAVPKNRTPSYPKSSLFQCSGRVSECPTPLIVNLASYFKSCHTPAESDGLVVSSICAFNEVAKQTINTTVIKILLFHNVFDYDFTIDYTKIVGRRINSKSNNIDTYM